MSDKTLMQFQFNFKMRPGRNIIYVVDAYSLKDARDICRMLHHPDFTRDEVNALLIQIDVNDYPPIIMPGDVRLGHILE